MRKAALALLGCLAGSAPGEVRVTTESGFGFESVPPPATNDAATGAIFRTTVGERDRNGGDLEVLHDGKLPTTSDQPAANFFFAQGTDGGEISIDLGAAIEIARITTYSWHRGDRGPQVYSVFGADESSPGEWTLLAAVDTRPKPGRHAVMIADPEGELGTYRHLRFAISRTQDNDPFGNTFFSEIDVIDADGPELIATDTTPAKAIFIPFTSDGEKYRFTINASEAPDLAEWSEKMLKPVVQEWYPKIVALLPSDGYSPPDDVTLRYRHDMGGIPASAGGAGVNLNAGWFPRQLDREARGAVVHELVHVVQQYRRGSRENPTPGWLVEGIADYVRWFLYEPESRGAEITNGNFLGARYDSSYRITANFLDWVTREHDPAIVPKLNAALREGSYAAPLWEEWTGKSVDELGDRWKEANRKRLTEG